MKNKIKAILFDMDGVLVDSAKAWFHTVNGTLDHYGLKRLGFKDFMKGFGTAIEKDAKTIYRGKSIKEIAAFYDKSFSINIKKVKIFNGTIPALKSIKKLNIKTALITNSTRKITNSILNHYKLKKYFDVVVTGQDVKNGKPAPDMALKACKKLRINPKNAILVGDTKADMTAGKRAGCIAVGYMVKGDYRISRLIEIEKFIYV